MERAESYALVVDDEQSIRSLCQAVLEQLGFTVVVAENGSEALALLQGSSTFDLMLLDLHLPGLNGVEVLRSARARLASLAVVVMTGFGSLEVTAEATLLGAQAILFKPFSLGELRDVISEVLRKRRAERSEAQVAALHPLVAISERLNGQLMLPALCSEIVSTANEALFASQSALLRENDGNMVLAAQAIAQSTNMQLWQPLAFWLYERRTPVALSGRILPSDDMPILPIPHDCVVLAAPLIAHNRVLGALIIEAKAAPGIPTAAQTELLTVLARFAATALENAELHTKVARSEERYRALLEHAHDAVLLLDRDTAMVLEANAAVSSISGYSRAELLAMRPGVLFSALEDRAERSPSTEFETVLNTREGNHVPVSVGLSDVVHDGAHYQLLIARDIGERQRMMQQLMLAEKLSGMGRLSASIAHEINNPLQALQSSLNLLVERQMSEERRMQILQMAREQSLQLVGIVQHMLDLYRPVSEGMRLVSPHELLEGALTVVTPRLREDHIQVERRLESYLPRVRAVSSQLKQVLINLLNNAIDAMPRGGTLTVSTRVSGDAPHQTVFIDVTDVGRGIPPETLKSIFEPFYSTNTGRTGLSLAVSYNIIEQHEGALSVETSPHGTTFTIALPAIS